jgi:histone-lysine N-methyltransferase SETD2
MGYGAQAVEDIQKGEFVMEYVGELITEEEKEERLSGNESRHHYTMKLGDEEFIDPALYGNFGRFLNHSCDPNCETQMWIVKGRNRMGFFAKRFIPKGEDLTFNYQVIFFFFSPLFTPLSSSPV